MDMESIVRRPRTGCGRRCYVLLRVMTEDHNGEQMSDLIFLYMTAIHGVPVVNFCIRSPLKHRQVQIMS